MSPRLWCALLGVVFGVMWAEINIGWAVVVLVCSLVGYAIGAALEGTIDVSGLVAPLRQPRH
ncbi:MAG: hypothetical protein JWO59_2921 [Chloroflexi bacterium]|nr:hypothetical protein [Chloroflexota bacterium]